MSKQHIQKLIQNALETLASTFNMQNEWPAIQIESTKDKQHGDFACNIALILAKPLKRKPREIADLIVQSLTPSSKIKKIEIAGPGFINFFLSQEALYSVIPEILTIGERYGHCNAGQGKKIIVEYVSSNPTGPLHVGHGRHAAYGAVVSDLLETIGYSVFREYYVNDAGRQMDILTASTWLRYLELSGEKIIFPANAYKGNYVIEIARALQEKNGQDFYVPAEQVITGLPLDEPEGGDKEIYIDAIINRCKKLLGPESYENVFNFTLNATLSDIHNDLSEFGVHFQNWFSEKEFVKTDAVDTLIHQLQTKQLTYERDGALWFRSTDFNDDKDRVLQRSNGQRTYYANDFAYHINKFTRGFDSAIDIFGSDHHGYIPRMKAGLMAQGIPGEKLSYFLLQFVTLYRSGEQVQMSTRSGSFVTLRELREEVGNDAARYFYVMRKCEQHIDFDLDLAKAKSNENPVYYIQYAHARICSVLRQLEEKGFKYEQDTALAHIASLNEEIELQLLSTLGRYCDTILHAAQQHEPHLLTNYLRELAGDFHSYYNSHQFLVEDEALRNSRISLILATRQVLINGLKLLGVSTPESM
ncbi:MAG: arginine--tRNA ligase [Gammaproteobacteria bacterium]|nr:arginine--tRNA ligase [Gammaproteobacteria bacterium]